MTHCDMLYRMDISVLFWWTIAVSDFRPLEIYKNVGLPLSTINFTVNSHADNHYYKYIYLFQILYNMKSDFLLKYTLRFWPKVFIFKFDLNALICIKKNDGLLKKTLEKEIAFLM